MTSDHTKIEPLTRVSVLRDIVRALTSLARGRLTVAEIEDAVDSILPTFEAIATTFVQARAAAEPDIRPRLATAMRELGEEGVETIGIIVSYAGSTMDLFPGEEWTAVASCDPVDDSEGTDARGVGATCRAALEQCASEVFRMEAGTGKPTPDTSDLEGPEEEIDDV